MIYELLTFEVIFQDKFSGQGGQGVQFCRFLCLHVGKLTKCWNAITPQNGQSRSIMFSDKGKLSIDPSAIVQWMFMK